MSNVDKNRDKQPDKEELRSTADFEVPVCGPGTQIGQFRIEREIGRGGMGVVYLAHDSKLDRQVAIKSIPPALTDNTKVKSRFRREAKLLASLDHPDIATIYDIIEGDKGIAYLVLEYIPGDTLADCIARGPLPPKEVLSLSGQIASAFASAHEHGIVHRDLKPANIKITKEQRIKVLDFGIAKAVGEQASDAYTTVTEPGKLIGTPAYMSPEQVRGKPADRRSDIWAFGCVLYEMLTGKATFEGETASDTLARILEREPDLDALPDSTPANIKVLIRRCLEKDPQQRLQHFGDVGLEIHETVNRPASAPPMSFPPTRPEQVTMVRRVTAGAIVAVLLTAVTASLITRRLSPSPSSPSSSTVRVAVLLQPDKSIYRYRGGNSLALSPDGSQLAYVSVAKDRRRQLCVRELDKFNAEPLPDTENAFDPFFSPDGQWLAFFTQDTATKSTLWKLKLGGNEPRISLAKRRGRLTTRSKVSDFTPSVNFYGGSWSDDVIVFCSYDPDDTENAGYSLFKVSAFGGTPKIIFKTDSPSHTVFADNSYPQLLPGGKAVISGGYEVGYLLSLETGERTTLIENAQRANYSPTGHLLFGRDDQLFAVPFDVDKLEITGPEVPLISDLCMPKWGHEPNYSISRNGTLAYVPLSSDLPSLVWADHQGNSTPVLGAPGKRYAVPRLSPDETQIVVHTTPAETGLYRIWRHDLKRNVLGSLTPDGVWCHTPCWIPPDGRRISFTASLDLAWMNVDGSGELELILPPSEIAHEVAQSWSSDGRYLAYRTSGPMQGIWILPMEDNGKPGEPARITDAEEINPMICPVVGRYLAFTSKQTGQSEIYVAELQLDNLTKGWSEKISANGGTEPCWSRDGSKLYYRSPEGMMEVSINSKPDGSIEIGKGTLLFDDHMYGTEVGGITNYDVTSDGRFLMIKEASHTQINIVLNWSEELKRLAPMGKK